MLKKKQKKVIKKKRIFNKEGFPIFVKSKIKKTSLNTNLNKFTPKNARSEVDLNKNRIRSNHLVQTKVAHPLKAYRDLYIYTKNSSSGGFFVDVYITKLNILISLSRNPEGSMFCFSQGMLWQKYLKKGSQDAGSKVAYVFAKKVFSRCYYPLILRLRTRINLITEGVMEGFCDARLHFMFCVLAPTIKHNGCRNQKRRRKKIRTRRRASMAL